MAFTACEPWSARKVLEAWGLRQAGSLKTPYRPAMGGAPTTDDEWQALLYVEALPGIDRARSVLAHVYAHGLPVESFRVRFPGETLAASLLRRGWGMYLGKPNAAKCVHDEFLKSLERTLAESPFMPVRVEVLDAFDIAREVNAR